MATLTYFEAVLLGLVQGLAEFLPVSSSGHLALIQHFFGISGDSVLLFTVMLHLGTLISVFIIYWKDIARLLYELGRCIGDICRGRGPRININETRRLGFMIIVATIPTAIIGLLFNKTFEAFYTNMQMDISLENNRKKIGTVQQVIIESRDSDGTYIGRTRYDAPEIDDQIVVASRRDHKPGDIIEVTVTDAFDYDLVGTERGEQIESAK